MEQLVFPDLGGIQAGVVVDAVQSAIIASLLIAYFTRKGFAFYMRR